MAAPSYFCFYWQLETGLLDVKNSLLNAQRNTPSSTTMAAPSAHTCLRRTLVSLIFLSHSSLPDFSPRIPLGTFSILLLTWITESLLLKCSLGIERNISMRYCINCFKLCSEFWQMTPPVMSFLKLQLTTRIIMKKRLVFRYIWVYFTISHRTYRSLIPGCMDVKTYILLIHPQWHCVGYFVFYVFTLIGTQYILYTTKNKKIFE